MHTFENWLLNFMHINLSIWESAYNRKKFMMLVDFSRTQTLRWRLVCRMFTKECFGAQHLWKGGEGRRIGKRRIWAAVQALPLPCRLHSTSLLVHIGPKGLDLYTPWKWAGCSGNGMMLDEEARSWEKFFFRGGSEWHITMSTKVHE